MTATLELQEAIQFHYDLPPEFFKLFIDAETESYTCAYFKDATTTLAEAQRRKLTLVLDRKLQLKPGDRVLDIGCGWGNVLFWCVDRGCTVTGLTLAPEQAAYIRSEAERRGVADKVEVVIAEARELPFADQSFDKVVTLGATEHVEDLGTLFREVGRVMTDDGLFLQHAMTGPIEPFLPSLEDDFIRKYVWPIGRFQRLHDYVRAMEEGGLEVIDVHDITDHYPHTLRNWLTNLETNGFEAAQRIGVGLDRYNAQRLLCAGCVVFFAESHIFVYQELAQKVIPGRLRRPLPAGRDRLQLDDPPSRPLKPPIYDRPLVSVDLAGASFWVEGSDGRLQPGTPSRTPDASVSLSADTISRLVAGEITVVDAFVSGDMVVDGDLVAVVQVRDALIAVAQGISGA